MLHQLVDYLFKEGYLLCCSSCNEGRLSSLLFPQHCLIRDHREWGELFYVAELDLVAFLAEDDLVAYVGPPLGVTVVTGAWPYPSFSMLLCLLRWIYKSCTLV